MVLLSSQLLELALTPHPHAEDLQACGLLHLPFDQKEYIHCSLHGLSSKNLNQDSNINHIPYQSIILNQETSLLLPQVKSLSLMVPQHNQRCKKYGTNHFFHPHIGHGQYGDHVLLHLLLQWRLELAQIHPHLLQPTLHLPEILDDHCTAAAVQTIQNQDKSQPSQINEFIHSTDALHEFIGGLTFLSF